MGRNRPDVLSAREPVRITFPRRSTTSTASTFGRIFPNRTVVVPVAFVAAMPPSVASAPGSIGNQSPCCPAARSSAARVTPGSTVAIRFSGSIETIRSMRDRSRLMPPSIGIT